MKRGYRAQPARNENKAALKLGLLVCECWCKKGHVWVNHDDLLEGRTYSCGRENCRKHKSYNQYYNERKRSRHAER